MLGSFFYNSHIKKYTALFGNLFNNISIQRETKQGERVQLIKVPISYSSKQKQQSRLDVDPALSRDIAIQLPRMAFEITNINYDPDRKLNTVARLVDPRSQSSRYISSVYNPVPYNINFMLTIYAKNYEDASKIIEQIIPYFTPDWTETVEVMPGINQDIPIIFNNLYLQDIYEGAMEDRRYIMWTLDFTMKCYFYGPQRRTGYIKKVIANIFGRGQPTIQVKYNDLLNNFVVGESFYQSNGSANVAIGTIVQANTLGAYLMVSGGQIQKDQKLYGVDSGAQAMIYTYSEQDIPNATITITPGMLANGAPTSNAELSVDYRTIEPTDDFGFCIDIDENI